MMVFLARAALGGGANLVCTVLLLALAARVALGKPLGRGNSTFSLIILPPKTRTRRS